MQTSPAVEQIKTLNGPRVRGISPVIYVHSNNPLSSQAFNSFVLQLLQIFMSSLRAILAPRCAETSQPVCIQFAVLPCTHVPPSSGSDKWQMFMSYITAGLPQVGVLHVVSTHIRRQCCPVLSLLSACMLRGSFN